MASQREEVVEMGGYAALHNIGIQVRADMLESVAGLEDDAEVFKEFYFAIRALDWDDPAELRWVASLIARHLDEISAEVDS